jgi:hypothetical protein
MKFAVCVMDLHCANNSKVFFTTPFLILPTLLGFPNIAMRLRSGAEERGYGYRVKEARIYVQLQLQSTSSSRPVLRSRP